jgi:PTH1 family peptidyl-tRNA hydrolase
MSDRRTLLVGLGNPGPRYARNRHNIGFMALDEIARVHRAAPWRARFQGEAAEATIAGERALLLKPLTYMNESGRSVGEAMRFFKLTPADVVVFHDELDLAPAKLRAKQGGGHAGHNGLRSIQAAIGAEFRRIRMGIGHPGDKALVHPYVLGDFAKAEEPWVDDLCRASADACPQIMAGDDARFQNDVALAMQKRGWSEVKRVGERPAD